MVRKDFTPVPTRFPEADRAFLYAYGDSSIGLPLIAIMLMILGLVYLWRWRRTAEQKQPPGFSGYGALFLIGFSALLTIASPLFIWLDSMSYDALTSEGYVGRSLWTGSVEHAQWSSLHHWQLDCWGGGGRTTNPGQYPYLILRFTGSDARVNVTSMRAYLTTKRQALKEIDDIRIKQGAPLIWEKRDQQEKFLRKDTAIRSCVNEFLEPFPVERQKTLFAILMNSPTER
jgi:hypothetical protein